MRDRHRENEANAYENRIFAERCVGRTESPRFDGERMLVKKWDKLPEFLRTDEVRPYYERLRKKNFSLWWKRAFDIFASVVMLAILSPLFLILAAAIKLDSRGPVFYRQERVTQYGRHFRIHKFRTMVAEADRIGSAVTTKGDARITRVGRAIRKLRLDEVSQLLDVLGGSMTFVGTRPEVSKYVACYTPEMYATLLLPAGITSEASIKFKDEDELLAGAENIDEAYVTRVLPEKMEYNLASLKKYGFWRDIGTMFRTVAAVLKR